MQMRLRRRSRARAPLAWKECCWYLEVIGSVTIKISGLSHTHTLRLQITAKSSTYHSHIHSCTLCTDDGVEQIELLLHITDY